MRERRRGIRYDREAERQTGSGWPALRRASDAWVSVYTEPPRPRVHVGRDWPAEMTCLSLPRPSAA
jgi:hypothetical protein